MYLINTVNSAVGHHDTDEASGKLRRHGTIIIGSIIAEFDRLKRVVLEGSRRSTNKQGFSWGELR
jgi:hypothetical protein